MSLAIALVAAVTAQGAFIATTPTGYSIQDVVDGVAPFTSAPGTFVIEDKEFTFTAASVSSAVLDADQVLVSGGFDDNNNNGVFDWDVDYVTLRFNMALLAVTSPSYPAGAATVKDVSINFEATVLDPRLFFKDVGLHLTGVSAVGPGVVTVSEQVREDDINGQVLASLNTTVGDGAGLNEADAEVDFPSLAKTIFVTKDIVANADVIGDGQQDPTEFGLAHLSDFFQTFSQDIPEPAAIAVMSLGLTTMLVRRRKA